MITLIAAIGKQNELGSDNDLMWHLPDDFRWFVNNTKGKAVVMGRKTMESLGKPLKDRLNLVISRNKVEKEGFEWVKSIDQAVEEALKFSDEIMVIGGGEIYNQTISLADKLLITKVNFGFPQADVFFPKINEDWKVVSEVYHPKDDKHKHDFTFLIYEKRV